MEIVLKKTAVAFDATDISLVYARILKEQWNNDRKLAEGVLFTKLVKLLQIKNYQEEELKFILKNWCVLLLSHEEELRTSKKLKTMLKDLFEIKASGAEEDYISGLQRNPELKRLLEEIVKENI